MPPDPPAEDDAPRRLFEAAEAATDHLLASLGCDTTGGAAVTLDLRDLNQAILALRRLIDIYGALRRLEQHDRDREDDLAIDFDALDPRVFEARDEIQPEGAADPDDSPLPD